MRKVSFSDGDWTFFYALDYESLEYVVMRAKEGQSPWCRCLEYYITSGGRKVLPLPIRVHHVDLLNWMDEKMVHLMIDYGYDREDFLAVVN